MHMLVRYIHNLPMSWLVLSLPHPPCVHPTMSCDVSDPDFLVRCVVITLHNIYVARKAWKQG